jgi:hypothetical protein
MHDLVDFLVEERYCNTESEAIKIIESVSDEFYEYLIETEKLTGKERIKDIQTRRAPERLAAMRTRLKTLTKSAQENPKSIKPKTVEQINRLRVIIPDQESLSKKEMEKRKKEGTASKGLQPTPRGPGGGAQTSDIAATRTAAARRDRPMTGARINDPRVAASAERRTSRMTGTSSEVGRAGGASRQFTGVVRTGKYTQMQSGTGATEAVPNKGTSRTGARFPRQGG